MEATLRTAAAVFWAALFSTQSGISGEDAQQLADQMLSDNERNGLRNHILHSCRFFWLIVYYDPDLLRPREEDRSDKIDLKANRINRDNMGHFTMTKDSIH